MSSRIHPDAGRTDPLGHSEVTPRSWLSPPADADAPPSEDLLQTAQDKFRAFRTVLDYNGAALRIISDMEEKCQGEYLFDTNYIRNSLSELRIAVGGMIRALIELGGAPYRALIEAYRAVDSRIHSLMPGCRTLARDRYVLPLTEVDRERAPTVGGKCAHVGELRGRLGLPTPDGFAVTAWAYQHFIDQGRLQGKIDDLLDKVDIRSYPDLVKVSRQIQRLVAATPVPDDLAAEIRAAAHDLRRRTGNPAVSLRSSAIGEDTIFSFAGQYTTLLNVRDCDPAACYREVLAGKFTPQAIYYLISRSMSEADLEMGVCCLEMIDSHVSGVVYTRDPVAPDREVMVVSSIYGLGKFLVDGTVTPDVFIVSRPDAKMVQSLPARKEVRLVLNPAGGVRTEPVPDDQQTAPTLTPDQLRRLAEVARKTEEHYDRPQDLEFAFDHTGRLFLLQCRPLHLVRAPDLEPAAEPPGPALGRGMTICPGAACGPVFPVLSSRDLPHVPDGAVLVTPQPFPGLVTAFGRIAALVSGMGGVAGHMATLAREFRIPALASVENARDLPPGEPVTVNATAGLIYAGCHPQLVERQRHCTGTLADTPIYDLLRAVLTHISPLTLLNPTAPEFRPENCRTFHDLTRFAHQKAMEEMFSRAREIEAHGQVMQRLISGLPIEVNLIYLDRVPEPGAPEQLQPSDLDCPPMQAFWRGILTQGWPAGAPPTGFAGLKSAAATAADEQVNYSTKSYAILSRDYMVLSLRMGYHFTTVEAMAGGQPPQNYIHVQHRGGGASPERRRRRVQLLSEILETVGFEVSCQGDFLDARLQYVDADTAARRLELLGRLTMLTKQLDMALASDPMTEWYAADIRHALGLPPSGTEPRPVSRHVDLEE